MNHSVNQKPGLNFTTAQTLSISSWITQRKCSAHLVRLVFLVLREFEYYFFISSWASAKWLHLHLVKYKCPIVVKQEYSNGSLKRNLVTYKIFMHHFRETSTREKILMKQTANMIWKQGNKQPGKPVTLSKQTADVYMSVSITVIWILISFH